MLVVCVAVWRADSYTHMYPARLVLDTQYGLLENGFDFCSRYILTTYVNYPGSTDYSVT